MEVTLGGKLWQDCGRMWLLSALEGLVEMANG
jgi:hypothetical protein